MNERHCGRTFTLQVVTGFLVATAAAFGQGAAETRTWAGAPGGAWNVAGNWNPAGVPDGNDTAIVGPDKGEIVVPSPPGIVVATLEIQASTAANPADDTTLRGNPNLTIRAGMGGVSVGQRCLITGGAGVNGVAGAGGNGATPGGNVDIRSDGDVVNDGEIRGGSGGTGPAGIDAMPGGWVRIFCKRLFNTGLIKGGKGGDKTAAGGNCGIGAREGGDVRVHTTQDGSNLGNLDGGDPGVASPGVGPNGNKGRVVVTGKAASLAPSKSIGGRKISFDGQGSLDLAGAQAGAMVSEEPIRIEIQLLNLVGIPAGTHVFQAPSICFRCDTILLDPGVQLTSLCGSATVYTGGTSCATEASLEMFGPESFDGAAVMMPSGWTLQTLQGTTGFLYNNPSMLPLHPNFGCHAAVANAQMNGPGPLQARIATPSVSMPANATGPLILEWAQWYQPSPGSSAQVTVTVDGNPFNVLNLVNPTPQYDFFRIDLGPILPGGPGGHVVSATFTLFTGFNQGHWVIDDVTFRIPWLPLPGQPAQPGAAVLEVNNARNANNVPPFFGESGPYFTQVGVGETANVVVLGPPNQQVVFGTGFLLPGAVSLPPFGTLDLDPLGLLLYGPFPMPPFGPLNLPVLVPPALSGLTLGLQAAVTQPAAGLSLSNAVEVRFGP